VDAKYILMGGYKAYRADLRIPERPGGVAGLRGTFLSSFSARGNDYELLLNLRVFPAKLRPLSCSLNTTWSFGSDESRKGIQQTSTIAEGGNEKQ
jgi:hypothetical protein